MTKDNIDFTLIKEAIIKNTELSKYIRNILKNTEFNTQSIDELTPKALALAYKFAKTNIQISNEVGIPMSPMYKTTINRRNMDMEFIKQYERSVI